MHLRPARLLITLCALGLAGCVNARPPSAPDAASDAAPDAAYEAAPEDVPEVSLFEERAPEFIEIDQVVEGSPAEGATGGERSRPPGGAPGEGRESRSSWFAPPDTAPTAAPPPTKRYALAHPNAPGELVVVVRTLSTDRPVVDAVVTLRSPVLVGELTVVTDAAGAFRFEKLPPSEYSMTVDADAHHPASRSGLTLRPGAKLRVDVRLPYRPDNTVLTCY